MLYPLSHELVENYFSMYYVHVSESTFCFLRSSLNFIMSDKTITFLLSRDDFIKFLVNKELFKMTSTSVEGQDLNKKVEAAQRFQESNIIGEAIKLYEDVIKFPIKVAQGEELAEDIVKAKEQATYKLAGLYKEKSLIEELISL